MNHRQTQTRCANACVRDARGGRAPDVSRAAEMLAQQRGSAAVLGLAAVARRHLVAPQKRRLRGMVGLEPAGERDFGQRCRAPQNPGVHLLQPTVSELVCGGAESRLPEPTLRRFARNACRLGDVGG